MNKTNAIIWFEWFNEEKENVFESDTKNLWGLALRNGIAPTIFRKWLREEICKSIDDEDFDKTKVQLIENQWANQKYTAKIRQKSRTYSRKLRISEDNLNFIVLTN